MISVDVEEHWDIHDLMARVSKIEENMLRSKLGKDIIWSKGQASKAEEIDWEPTAPVKVQSAYNHNAKRSNRSSQNVKETSYGKAKWASIEERNYRRENDLCLRCGKQGHYIGKCRLSPAEKPIKAAKAAIPEAESESESENEEEDAFSEN